MDGTVEYSLPSIWRTSDRRVTFLTIAHDSTNHIWTLVGRLARCITPDVTRQHYPVGADRPGD